MLADESSGAWAYESYPLAGSPTRRLVDDAAQMLSQDLVARCPHPGEPAFWYLPAATLACAACVGELLGADTENTCEACGAPASAFAAWVVSDVPCIAGLCESCRSIGLVPLAAN